MALLRGVLCICACICLTVADNNSKKDHKGTTGDRYETARTFRDGDFVANVYDNAMPFRRTFSLNQLLTTFAGGWQFAYPQVDIGKRALSKGDLHWLYYFEPEFLKKSIVASVCRNVMRRLNRGVNYYPREAFATMLLRGMAPTLIENDEDSDELYTHIFLTENLKKNDYGQLSLYTKDKDSVLGSVFPKFKRLVVFNGSTPFIIKPPAMGNSQAEYALLIKWTPNITRFEEGQKAYEEMERKRNESNTVPFPLLFDLPHNSIYSEPKFQNHVTDIFYDMYGNHVAVFDDLFSKDELHTMRKYLATRDGRLKYNGYVAYEDDDNDNVNWISAFDINEFIKSKAWNVVYDMTVYLSGRTGWYPYDITLNTIQSSHHTRFHTDCMDDEFEYTFLLYLNPVWTQDMYGETVFTDHKPGYEEVTNGAKQKYDVKAVVQPKYGRIAMFRNIINHSARPPSPEFFDSRYSFAVKVSVNKRVAQAKTLQELLEFVQEGDDGYDLQQDLSNRKYNKVTPDEPKDFINTNMNKFEKVKNDRERETVQNLRQSIINDRLKL